EKFYEEAFFEKIFPTVPKPFFEYLFQILGNGDKITCPLVWKKKFFSFVQLEGYVISQADSSYLVNVLISPTSPDQNIKFSWLLDISQDKVYFATESSKGLKSVIDWKEYFISKFDFLDKENFSEFIQREKSEVLTIFPEHLCLKKKPLSTNY